MKTTLVIALLALGLQSCTSKDKPTDTKTEEKQVENSQKQSFDIAKLTFNETIEALTKQTGLTLKDSVSTEKTLFGYERVETRSDKALIYGQTDLAGGEGINTNKVVFHYADADQKLALIELRLYTPKPNAALVGLINNAVSTQPLEKSVKDDESGVVFKQYVWHKADIIYLLLQETDPAGTIKTSNLAIFKNNNKDFYTLLGQKGYAIDAKALIEEALKKG